MAVLSGIPAEEKEEDVETTEVIVGEVGKNIAGNGFVIPTATVLAVVSNVDEYDTDDIEDQDDDDLDEDNQDEDDLDVDELKSGDDIKSA